MGISNYGLWKCTPTSWNGTADTDHGHLEFTDGTNDNKTYEADVNIMSSDSDKRLVYWFVSNFDAKQPSTSQLSALSKGFSTQKGSSSLALDFLREGFLDVNDGTLLSHDPQDPDEKGDILSYLDPIMNQAVQEKATLYLWGSHYSDKGGAQGIHDIHMNQGNAGSFEDENGTYQDGGIVIEFASGKWQGVFLAFATQTLKTDDSGNPEGETFAQALGGDSTSKTSTAEARAGAGGAPHSTTRGTVGIEAALVNPRGPDAAAAGKGPGRAETVWVQNRGAEPQSLDGWRVESGSGAAHELRGAGARVGAHAKKGFEVPGAPLSNRGGRIVLKDAQGTTVSEVSYTEAEARKEGRLLYFAN